MDSINANNPIAVDNITITGGEVGNGFSFNGSSSDIIIPTSTSLAVTNLTCECWIDPANTQYEPILEYGGPGIASPVQFWLNGTGFSSIPGLLYGIIRSGGPLITSAPGVVPANQWSHVAFTFNPVTGKSFLYYNGVQVANVSQAPPAEIDSTHIRLYLGYRDAASSEALAGYRYAGKMDEVSIYNRSLSPSEIKAIYQKGTAGKFDPITFNTSPAQSLAEAQFGATGQSAAALYGSNTTWQTYTATFKAVTNHTTLTLAGVEPGVLLGPLLMTSPVLVTNVATNIYYLAFTENTNLTTTPIKFAPPPYVPPITTPTNVLTDGFEQTPAEDLAAVQTFGNGWIVTSDQVSIVTDPANAYEGSNYLALASGTIFTNLPTVAGNTYTLTFAYRGPGIAGWWRGENNVNDAIYGNNGTVQNAGFTNGVVGRAFSNDPENYPYGTYNGFDVPDQPAYQLTNSLSIEGWVRPRGDGYAIFWRGDSTPGYDPYFLSMQGNDTASFYITDMANNSVNVNGTLTYNVWHHVAATLDGTSGNMSLYVDGALASQINTPLRPYGALNPGLSPGIGIANVNDGQNNFPFTGDIDGFSLYSRALSASEVRAIYNAGDAGKFDPSLINTSPALSLAEAQVSLNGQAQGTLYGNNTNWQVETITFTATQNGTPLSIAGLEPGMLLDNFVLTAMPGNLYHQPEQSLNAFTGKSAYGDWQLEIQDDRAGAGLTNLLVSWELQFVFANTNAVPAVLSGGIGQSSQFIPAGDIAWYQINVPANANFATNISQVRQRAGQRLVQHQRAADNHQFRRC